MNLHLKIVHSCTKLPGLTLLEVESLDKSFSSNAERISVLKNVNFCVKQGEIISVLGRSGCGKSTLLKLLAGFLPPDNGTICLSGKAVVSPGPERSVIFQDDALFPWLTVHENIAFGLSGRKFKKKEVAREVDRYIGLVGLEGFGNYLPAEISGGMKQRVALARVLIMKPDVLLLDEPFAALDAQTREEMQDLLLAICQRLSHTVIFVTHDVNEAILLADRVLLFDKSRQGIKQIFDINLPRPRGRQDKIFVQMCDDVIRKLKDDILTLN